MTFSHLDTKEKTSDINPAYHLIYRQGAHKNGGYDEKVLSYDRNIPLNHVIADKNISTEIDGIERFCSPSKLCSYVGLVPSTHSSGGKTYHGKITSEGNRWIRWALVEAAVPASYADVEIRKRIDTLRKTKGANGAKTAIARWLLKVVYHVLKGKRPYVTDYNRIVKAGAAF